MTLAPTLGIGYRDWIRGEDTYKGSTMEEYTWWFVAAGVNFSYTINRVTIGASASLLLPFNQQMTTTSSGSVDKATFRIKSETGFSAERPVTYELYTTASYRFFVFGMLYYERWNIGKSPTITFTQNGSPVAYAF